VLYVFIVYHEAFSLKTLGINFDVSGLNPLNLKHLPQVTLAILGRFYKSQQSAKSSELRSTCFCWQVETP